jgi:hypothetical protein
LAPPARRRCFGRIVPCKRGPKTATSNNPLTTEVILLQRTTARLTQRFRAEAIIDIQKSGGLAGHAADIQRRHALTDAVVLLAPPPDLTTGVCTALGVSRASVHPRRIRLIVPPTIRRARPRPARALIVTRQRVVLDLLHSPRFADQAPTEIYATLLDDGVYHSSIRTMYRLLGQHSEVRERRRQLRHPVYQKPELLAEKPNEVWSLDITQLRVPTKWSYCHLYVIPDIFSDASFTNQHSRAADLAFTVRLARFSTHASRAR